MTRDIRVACPICGKKECEHFYGFSGNEDRPVVMNDFDEFGDYVYFVQMPSDEFLIEAVFVDSEVRDKCFGWELDHIHEIQLLLEERKKEIQKLRKQE